MSMPHGEAGLNSSLPPPVPVWAPNPAVPLPARILSYLFAGLTLLTALLGLVIQRPPDTPPEVKSWVAYRSSHGYTLPYPAGWEIQASNSKDADKISITLMSESPVQAMALFRQFPVQVNDAMLEQIADNIVGKLHEQYHNLAERDDGKVSDVADVEHSFTFTNDDGMKTEMAGTLIMRSNNNSVLLLVSTAPVEGWFAMKQITGHILEFTQFDQ